MNERSTTTHEVAVDEDGLVRITHHAPIRYTRSLEILKEALAMSSQTPRRVLTDLRSVGTADTRADQFRFSLEVGSTGLRVEDKIAALVAPLSTEHEFVEHAINANGYPNVRFFRDEAQARAYLGRE